ncbi:MAG TPA: AAA family ATPase [Verrucomicrobiales bacterium]|nr:AAA family ATPase [Verrucomicrobiales bacterium]
MPNLDTLRQALSESPDNVALLQLFATSCLDAFSLTEAREAYEKVLQIQANDVEAQLGIARVLFLEGRISEAAIRAESIVHRQPRYAPAWLFLSRLSLVENDHRSAESHYRRALEIDPSSSDAALESELRTAARLKRGASSPEPAPNPWSAGVQGPPADDDPIDPFFSADEESADDEEYEDDFTSADFQRPDVSFEDIAGMEPLKRKLLAKVIQPRRRSDLYRAYGKPTAGNLLLFGSPGSGKLFLGRSIAGELKANFFALALRQLLVCGARVAERNLEQVFDLAQENQPAVILFEDVDVLPGDAGSGTAEAGRAILHRLLSELEDLGDETEELLVIGTTAAPWRVPQRLLVHSAFQNRAFVPPPTVRTREAIVRNLTREFPSQAVNARRVARATEGFSTRDLRRMFERAADDALSEAVLRHRMVPLTTELLLRSAHAAGGQIANWLQQARSYAAYDNPGGIYDDLLVHLRSHTG